MARRDEGSQRGIELSKSKGCSRSFGTTGAMGAGFRREIEYTRWLGHGRWAYDSLGTFEVVSFEEDQLRVSFPPRPHINLSNTAQNRGETTLICPTLTSKNKRRGSEAEAEARLQRYVVEAEEDFVTAYHVLQTNTATARDIQWPWQAPFRRTGTVVGNKE